MGNMALMMAKKMSEKKMSHGGKCYACGGVVNPELQQSKMADGGMVDSPNLKEDYESDEGGGVDDSYDPRSVDDTDSDSDDLVFSPEEYGDKGYGEADNTEADDDGEDKRGSFLRAYMVHRRMRKG